MALLSLILVEFAFKFYSLIIQSRHEVRRSDLDQLEDLKSSLLSIKETLNAAIQPRSWYSVRSRLNRRSMTLTTMVLFSSLQNTTTAR